MNKIDEIVNLLPKDKIANCECGVNTYSISFNEVFYFGEDGINNIFLKYYEEYNVFSLVYMLILPTTKKVVNIKKLDFIDYDECKTIVNMFANKIK